MASPSVRSSTFTDGTTASATPVINLPATVSAGDTLIVLFRVAVAGAIGWPGGAGVWNEFFDASSDAADDQMAMAWKKADGTEGGTTIQLTCTSGKFAACAWAIQDAADPTVTPPQLSTVATGTTPTQPNPTTVTPTGGAKDYLFGTVVGMEGEATTPPTYPTGYTLGQQAADSAAAGAVTTNVRVAGAWKQANAASDDPGAWTYAGTLDDWTAYAVAVHPSLVQAVTGVFMSAASALFAGLLTVGAVDVAGATVASGSQLFGGSVQQEVVGAHVASTAQLFAGTVTHPAVFDDIRQDILDGIDSAQSEATGWDALRSTIPVSAVVRTSDTVVTITLPALPTYDIPAKS